MVGDGGAQPHFVVGVPVAGDCLVVWTLRRTEGATRGRLGGRRGEGSAMAQGPWFRPKRNGLGWTPITWQGWLVTILSCLVVVGLNLVLVLRLGMR